MNKIRTVINNNLSWETRNKIYRVRNGITKGVKRVGNELRPDVIHLFLLSPPLSGSSVFLQLIKTSPNVSVFPGGVEGQDLSEIKDVLFVDRRWDQDLVIDWTIVKKTFYKYWSPFKRIRFEKSPPHLIRASEIEREFNNAHFLITIRNPYAQIQGFLRREWSTIPLLPPAIGAAEFWVLAAKCQLENMENLKKSCFFTYEELTESTEETVQKIINFLPALESLDHQSNFSAKNITGKPISGLRNLNQDKIDMLTPQQILEINSVLTKHEDLLERFNYQLLRVD